MPWLTASNYPRKGCAWANRLIAPELYRSVDLQQEWGRLHAKEARIPQAGIAVTGKTLANDALQAKVMAAYKYSLDWCQQHALKCGEMVAKRIDLLTPEAVADSLAVSQMRHVSGQVSVSAL